MNDRKKIHALLAFLFVFSVFVPCPLSAFLYRPKHVKNYTSDFNLYLAPEISRLKFQVENFAIYRGVFKGVSAGVEYRPLFWFYGGAFGRYALGPCSSTQKMSRYMHDVDGHFRFGYTFPMWNYHRLTFTLFFWNRIQPNNAKP